MTYNITSFRFLFTAVHLCLQRSRYIPLLLLSPFPLPVPAAATGSGTATRVRRMVGQSEPTRVVCRSTTGRELRRGGWQVGRWCVCRGRRGGLEVKVLQVGLWGCTDRLDRLGFGRGQMECPEVGSGRHIRWVVSWRYHLTARSPMRQLERGVAASQSDKCDS